MVCLALNYFSFNFLCNEVVIAQIEQDNPHYRSGAHGMSLHFIADSINSCLRDLVLYLEVS